MEKETKRPQTEAERIKEFYATTTPEERRKKFLEMAKKTEEIFKKHGMRVIDDDSMVGQCSVTMYPRLSEPYKESSQTRTDTSKTTKPEPSQKTKTKKSKTKKSKTTLAEPSQKKQDVDQEYESWRQEVLKAGREMGMKDEEVQRMIDNSL